jgi:hypothetical protein
MVRRFGLAVLAFAAIGCGGGGDNGTSPTTQTFTSMNGELTDGDVLMLDDQRADPYDFLGVASGPARVRLRTQGLHALLRVHDTEGNLLAQSVANGDFEAHVDFTALNTTLYKVIVVASAPGELGPYTIEVSPQLQYWSQIK